SERRTAERREADCWAELLSDAWRSSRDRPVVRRERRSWRAARRGDQRVARRAAVSEAERRRPTRIVRLGDRRVSDDRRRRRRLARDGARPTDAALDLHLIQAAPELLDAVSRAHECPSSGGRYDVPADSAQDRSDDSARGDHDDERRGEREYATTAIDDDDAWRVRARGARARGDRPLRRDQLFRRAAHAGVWRTRRAGRPSKRSHTVGARPSSLVYRRGSRARSRRRVRDTEVDRDATLRRRTDGCADAYARGGGAYSRRGDRERDADAPRGTFRSPRGVAGAIAEGDAAAQS